MTHSTDKPRRSWTTEEVLRTASITPGTRGEMLRDYADMLERARSTVMPEDVAYALNRMCTPLDESMLKGVTASEDARCMRVLQEYVESVAPARLCEKQDAARYRWLRDHATSQQVERFGSLIKLDAMDEYIDAALPAQRGEMKA